METYFQALPVELIIEILQYSDNIDSIKTLINLSITPETFNKGNQWRTIHKNVFVELDLSYITGINYNIENVNYYIAIYSKLLNIYKFATNVINYYIKILDDFSLDQYGLPYDKLTITKEIGEDFDGEGIIDLNRYQVSGVNAYKLFSYKDIQKWYPQFDDNICDVELAIFHDSYQMEIYGKGVTIKRYITKENFMVALMFMHFNSAEVVTYY
jgi:hypothetical protein